jgi:hypothetical protein
MFNTSRGLNGAGAILTLLAALLVPWQVALACNTNAWSSVTGAPQAIGPGTNPQGKAYEGDCALTANAMAPAFVSTQFAAEPSVSVRFYLLTEALNVPSSTVTVLSAEDGGTVAFQLQVQEVQGVKELLTRYRDNGSLKNHATRIPLLDTWHGIEVAWTTGAGNGAIEVSFDGMLYLSDKSLVNDGEMVDTLKLGVVQTPFGSGALVVDAVEVRNSGSIGLLEVNELRNISTRADVQSGNDILIAGFIISGDTDKCVVIRARGQSVNVPAGEVRLSDPILQLKSGSTTLDENDNWMDSPEAAIIQALGRAPDHPTDAAIYACLAPVSRLVCHELLNGLKNKQPFVPGAVSLCTPMVELNSARAWLAACAVAVVTVGGTLA